MHLSALLLCKNELLCNATYAASKNRLNKKKNVSEAAAKATELNRHTTRMKTRGSVVSYSFTFPHPPEDEKKKKKVSEAQSFARRARGSKPVVTVGCSLLS